MRQIGNNFLARAKMYSKVTVLLTKINLPFYCSLVERALFALQRGPSQFQCQRYSTFHHHDTLGYQLHLECSKSMMDDRSQQFY